LPFTDETTHFVVFERWSLAYGHTLEYYYQQGYRIYAVSRFDRGLFQKRWKIYQQTGKFV